MAVFIRYSFDNVETKKNHARTLRPADKTIRPIRGESAEESQSKKAQISVTEKRSLSEEPPKSEAWPF